MPTLADLKRTFFSNFWPGGASSSATASLSDLEWNYYSKVSPADSGASASRESASSLLGKLRASQPAAWINFGDSTSAHSYDWPYLLTSRMKNSYPNMSVQIAPGGAGGWSAPSSVSVGTSGSMFSFANAAQSGWASQDWITNFAAVASGYTPDFITVVLGHNDSTSLNGSTYTTLVNMIVAQWPNVPVLLCVQDPNLSNNDQTVRKSYIHSLAASLQAQGKRVWYTDSVWNAFGGNIPTAAMYSDSVHPTTPQGTTAWMNAIAAAIGMATDDTVATSAAQITALSNSVNAIINGMSNYINPLTMASWNAAYWANDPAWANPGNGNPVSSFRDGSGGGRDLTQATAGKKPTFVSALAALNNKSALAFTNTGLSSLVNSGSAIAISPPYTIVSVVVVDDLSQGHTILGHRTIDNDQRLGTSATASNWQLKSGTKMVGGVPTTGIGHLVVGFTDSVGTSCRIDVDSVNVVTGTAGNGGLNQLVMGAGNSGSAVEAAWMTGKIAFVGVVAGDATLLPWWPTFVAWIHSYYGI